MKLIVKTLHGAEQLLSNELKALGASDVVIARRSVNCNADKRLLYKVNLWSRLATRVLMPVCEFQASNDKQIYDHIYQYPWEHIIAPERTFLIDHISFSRSFPNSQWIAYKAKDAIVDRIRDKKGSRPSVSQDNPDVMLNIHAQDREDQQTAFALSLDATGYPPLNARGYRLQDWPSFTNPVLAQALLQLSGWTPEQPLIDPLCGAGTILIEAAMKALNIPPAIQRTNPFSIGCGFAFQDWLDFDPVMWQEILDEAKQARKNVRLSITGSDIDTAALDVARLSTLDLRINTDVFIMRKALREVERTADSGTIITCPPTNQDSFRRNLDDFYKEMAYYFSRNFPDHDAWIYSTSMKALRAIPFRAERKFQLYSGSTEGNFNLYPF